MTARAPVRVGVIGFGFMGRTHARAYRDADRAGFRNEVVAVCDRLPLTARRARGNLEASGDEPLFDPATVGISTEPQELLADPSIDLVSICTPTDTHVDLAIAALEAGKHVLVEKPVALRAKDAERLAKAAGRASTLCMPALCMRFWPGWDWLAERVRKGTFGATCSAVFRRHGSRPGWSAGFYDDYERSGGALFDLHVHDADFVRWCFGSPARVTASGSLDHVTALYSFPRGPAHVAAEGGWDHAPGFPFRMAYTVAFEKATADYDFGRTPRLLLARRGRSEPVALEPLTGYDGEVRHMIAAVRGKVALAATTLEAADLTHMLECERRSVESGKPVAL